MYSNNPYNAFAAPNEINKNKIHLIFFSFSFDVRRKVEIKINKIGWIKLSKIERKEKKCLKFRYRLILLIKFILLKVEIMIPNTTSKFKVTKIVIIFFFNKKL